MKRNNLYTPPYSDETRREAISRVASGEPKRSVSISLNLAKHTVGIWTSDIRRHVNVSEELKQKAIDLIKSGEPKKKVSLKLGISRSTITRWTSDIVLKTNYSAETVNKARERAKSGVSKKQIAREFGVSLGTIKNWTSDIKIANRFNEDEKNLAKRLTEEGNAKGTVAKELGMSKSTVERLAGHINNNSHDITIRRALVLRVRNGESLAAVARELNVSSNCYYRWEAQFNDVQDIPSEASIEEIHRLIEGGIALKDIASQHKISLQQLRVWKRIREGKEAVIRQFSEEERSAAVYRIIAGEKIATVAKDVGAETTTVRLWLRQAVESGVVIKPVTLSKSDDYEFSWIEKDYPSAKEWREYIANWFARESRGVGSKLTALKKFVRFVHENCTMKSPSEFLSRKTQNPDFFELFCSEIKDGFKVNNIIYNFLNSVLLENYSDEDDGHWTVTPLFKNPLQLRSSDNSTDLSESVREVLPYSYILELRKMLAEGPDFCDWQFAQNALGFETIKGRNCAKDWFPVTPEQIDRNDPDCVWRLRERNSKSPVLEMWSPVRWVLALTKLQVPARTGQLRMSDSGESDDWRYENGKFVPNTSALAKKYPKKTWQMGIFRRKKVKEDDYVSILYFNTNKTHDSQKSGSDKGQECPWPQLESYTENPYYWLEKLRNWQEKYNPVNERTPWTKIPASRSIGPKSQKQAMSYAPSCFLFRTPETPKHAHLPIGSGVLDVAWQRLMKAFEEKLENEESKHPDGSKILLLNPKNQRTFFPPHGLRVSLITSMVIDGEMPPELMMKIVGHSRLIMTLYYTKPGAIHLQNLLFEANKRAEEKKEASTIRFLKDGQIRDVEKNIVFNAASWASVISEDPTMRNPVGWQMLHDGICFAGGNTSMLDGDSKLPGCHNGGALISEARKEYGPVPGGPRNCGRCRWKATGLYHLPALIATVNNQLYHLHSAQEIAVAKSFVISDLKKERAACDNSNTPFLHAKMLKDAERLYDNKMVKISDLSLNVAANVKIVDRLIALSENSPKEFALVTAGDNYTARSVMEDTNSELLQLAGICSDVEIYPDLDPGTAVFRRSQLLDAALENSGRPPIFLRMEEKQQLRWGNAFMAQLSKLTNSMDAVAGLRKVVSVIDSGQSLSEVLGIELDSALQISQNGSQITIRSFDGKNHYAS
ncbi:hypothetical protein GTP46_28105 [Duganella sp. FT135W]|uniref:Uncharacterized protein n=1 Tax=Duganella flavida TaxID=2692175 RepID=A0A6L8KL92_9BURK|nr:VPA1269 family protein [Duganella flavida]MYM26494.1 hypothetical protein [Duganella flavida]